MSVYYKGVRIPGKYINKVRYGDGFGPCGRAWHEGVDAVHAKLELDKRLADAVKLTELQAEAKADLSSVVFPHDFIVDTTGAE